MPELALSSDENIEFLILLPPLWIAKVIGICHHTQIYMMVDNEPRTSC